MRHRAKDERIGLFDTRSLGERDRDGDLAGVRVGSELRTYEAKGDERKREQRNGSEEDFFPI